MKKTKLLALLCAAALLCALLGGCSAVWGGDKTAVTPVYYPVPDEQTPSPDKGESGGQETPPDETPEKYYGFTLELRQPGLETETEPDDPYPHATLDGELIERWEIPFYGNTVYESVTKYFSAADARGNMEFRLSQHKFYMFYEATLETGEIYNLETVYVDADGVYAMCANFQEVLGADGVAGTKDDLKILTLVYRGWIKA